jgi:predicted ribosome quality control (RQC) complex YloA/Tae2 family protein
MPLDAPVLACIAGEIHKLLPVKIDKIHQPYSDEFLFSCFGMGASFKLLISLNSQHGRCHIFDGTRENPVNPSAFCMLLRKHFGGSKLVAVEGVPFERMLKLVFEVYDPLSGLSKKQILLELTGKSANLVIANEQGLIIDAWRKPEPKHPGDREIAAGLPYELPPTGGRWQPVTLAADAFAALLGQLPPGVTIEKFLLKHWYGLSNLSIRQIAAAAALEADTVCQELTAEQRTALYGAFAAWARRVAAAEFTPTALYDAQGHAVDCSALAVPNPPAGLSAGAVANLNEAVAAIFNHRHELARFHEAKQNLAKKIGHQLDKTRAKLTKQQDEAARAERGDEYRICGELLTTYSYQVPKGGSEARLVNYYDPDGAELAIVLNPALTAQENAQSYFKKYQKAKKGQQAIALQIARTQEAIDYLESIESLITSAQSLADLKLVQEEIELADGRPAKPKALAREKAKKAMRREAPAEPRQYRTPSGHTILVGRNNLQNDKLTFKVADPTDWWFHTQKIPGSHVILRPQPGVAVDDETLNYACQLAAYFSKAQNSTKVPVDYTQRKNVKKPPGSKPGYVIYDYFKTAIITPDPQLLAEVGVEPPQ